MDDLVKKYLRPLRQLARLYNVQTDYRDANGRMRRASPQGLVHALAVLGAPLGRMEDLLGLLRERRRQLWRKGLEPVIVVWDGQAPVLKLTLPHRRFGGSLRFRIVGEQGDEYVGVLALAGAPRSTEIDNVRYLAHWLTLPVHLAEGYYQLSVEAAGRSYESLIIAAPSAVYTRPDREKRWGLFLPVYALRTARSWGVGDFGNLEKLLAWAAPLGVGLYSTLPLLAGFLREPAEASPYSPASRLFWNELYIDVAAVAELQECGAARALMDSPDFTAELAALRAAPLVEYSRAMAAKRRVLELLAQDFFARRSGARWQAFGAYLTARPELEDYARFRATGERHGREWRRWLGLARDGNLAPYHWDEAVKDYHCYVQWLADTQIEALAQKSKKLGIDFNLDFPLGVHPDGYDVWRERESFAEHIHGGAPPDAYFSKGQDWGFAPLAPEALRQQHYRYWIAAVRHHLRCADLLRIDHVMGLHRMFWIPEGLEPSDGVYVRYPAEEFYAILSLESQRARAAIVGENLGTVPGYVNRALKRHRIYGMFVAQLEFRTGDEPVLGKVPAHSVVSLNTHDTATFAGFWDGLDTARRLELGLIEGAIAQAERERLVEIRRELLALLALQEGALRLDDSAHEVAAALLTHLAQSYGEILLVNLEDLWGEPDAHNLPGSGVKFPNWQRKTRCFEEFTKDKRVLALLRRIEQLRRGVDAQTQGGTRPETAARLPEDIS